MQNLPNNLEPPTIEPSPPSNNSRPTRASDYYVPGSLLGTIFVLWQLITGMQSDLSAYQLRMAERMTKLETTIEQMTNEVKDLKQRLDFPTK